MPNAIAKIDRTPHDIAKERIVAQVWMFVLDVLPTDKSRGF